MVDEDVVEWTEKAKRAEESEDTEKFNKNPLEKEYSIYSRMAMCTVHNIHMYLAIFYELSY